jgi:hypothetical protein
LRLESAIAAVLILGSSAIVAAQAPQAVQAAEATAKQSAVRVLGTRVRISPPAGFEAATSFPGFSKKDEDASIVVSQLSGAYDQILAGFTQGTMGKEGLSVSATTPIKINGKPATRLQMYQNKDGHKYKKVAVVFPDGNTSILVTATMPDSGSEKLFQALQKAVETARSEEHAKEPAIEEGLSFSVADSRKFKKARRVLGAVVFTTTGKAKAGEDNGALFVVGQSKAAVAEGERKAFVKERLEHTPHLKNITIEKEEAISQAGLDGTEIIAQAVDSVDGVPTFVYHAILFDKDSYYLFQGLCPLAERAQCQPEYQNLVKNFQLR